MFIPDLLTPNRQMAASGFRSEILPSLHFLQLSAAPFPIPVAWLITCTSSAARPTPSSPLRTSPKRPLTLPEAENELMIPGRCSEASQGTSCSMFTKQDTECCCDRAAHLPEDKTKPYFLSQSTASAILGHSVLPPVDRKPEAQKREELGPQSF